MGGSGGGGGTAPPPALPAPPSGGETGAAISKTQCNNKLNPTLLVDIIANQSGQFLVNWMGGCLVPFSTTNGYLGNPVACILL